MDQQPPIHFWKTGEDISMEEYNDCVVQMKCRLIKCIRSIGFKGQVISTLLLTYKLLVGLESPKDNCHFQKSPLPCFDLRTL